MRMLVDIFFAVGAVILILSAAFIWLCVSEYRQERKRAKNPTPTYLDEATDRKSPTSQGDTGD